MTLQTGLRQNRKLAGLMGLSGYLPLASTVAAERHAANQDTPIFLAHGTLDPVVVLPRAEPSQQVLRDLGYQVNWTRYHMQHSVRQEEITAASPFLNKVQSGRAHVCTPVTTPHIVCRRMPTRNNTSHNCSTHT